MGPRADAPLRPASFDMGSARQAWRQFARARGGRLALPDDRGPSARRWLLGVALVGAVGLAAWSVLSPGPTDGDAGRSGEHGGAAAGLVDGRAGGADSRSDGGAVARDSDHGADARSVTTPRRTGEGGAAPVRLDGRRAPRPVEGAQAFPPTLRVPPPGTAPEHAKALAKVPKGRRDRPPLGAAGEHGVHVDRVRVSASYDDGRCGAAATRVSLDETAVVHLCLRVVHQRVRQALVLRWSRDGALVRRTRLAIPARHAYRTRAGLPIGSLRGAAAGAWTVEVVTPAGVELARASFQVAAGDASP